MIKIRNRLFARKKRQPNNETIKKHYNLFRNRVSCDLKKSKKKYYSEFFEENKTNIKKIWSGIREIDLRMYTENNDRKSLQKLSDHAIRKV